MRVYLAGPMRHIPLFNFPAFFDAEARLKQRGHKVFNPARRDTRKHGTKFFASNKTGSIRKAANQGFSLRKALADDTAYICLKADAVAMLPGWKNSKGAMAERALGIALGLRIIYL